MMHPPPAWGQHDLRHHLFGSSTDLKYGGINVNPIEGEQGAPRDTWDVFSVVSPKHGEFDCDPGA